MDAIMYSILPSEEFFRAMDCSLYVSKFAYLQISTHVCKSVHGLRMSHTELNSENSRISALKSAARFLCSVYLTLHFNL